MAMPRRRTQTLTVDGEPYRWRATRRSILVEHVNSDGGRVCEFLTLQERIGPERIPHLVRHARTYGWNPAEDEEVFELSALSVWDDPRPRDYYLWMRLLLEQLHHIESYIGCPVELGAFWWHGNVRTELGGLGARLRFGPCAMVPEAETWEAAYCITGTEGMQAYSDVFAFPYRGGENLGFARQESWHLWLKQDCEQAAGVWRAHGWMPWESAETWQESEHPGQIFSTVDPADRRVEVKRGEPIPIRIALGRPSVQAGGIFSALHLVEENSRGVLFQTGTGDFWFSWADRPVKELDHKADSVLIEADLGQHVIPGGWEPGEYQVMLRVRHEDGAGQGHSDITTPVTVIIS